MVEVFKTNITSETDAVTIVNNLKDQFPLHRINFDLHDCDNILRVEGNDICIDSIIQLLTQHGYHCSVLE